MRYVLGEGGKIGKHITSRNQNIQQLKPVCPDANSVSAVLSKMTEAFTNKVVFLS